MLEREADYLGRAVEIRKGFLIPTGYGSLLPASSRFGLTLPDVRLRDLCSVPKKQTYNTEAGTSTSGQNQAA